MKNTRKTTTIVLLTAAFVGTASLALAQHAAVGFSFQAIDNSILFGVQADADPDSVYPSIENINTSFVLQPSLTYYLGLSGVAQSQIFFPGSAGFRSAVDLDITFGSPYTVSAFLLNSFDVDVRQVYGQPDEIHHSESGAFPFVEAFSAAVTGATSRSSATGTYSATMNGLTLHLDGALSADSSATGGVTSNFGHGFFNTQLGFTVDQATTISLSGTISASGRGSSQDYPLLPVLPPTPEAPTATFINAPSGNYYDPPLTSGYDFVMTGGSLFTDILNFPTGIDGDGNFEVWVGNTSIGVFSVGQQVNFPDLLGTGVSSFRVTGIDPSVDGGDPLAFPIQLGFDTPTADFTMTAVETVVPEPATYGVMVGLGLLGFGVLRRRRQKKAAQ